MIEWFQDYFNQPYPSTFSTESESSIFISWIKVYHLIPVQMPIFNQYVLTQQSTKEIYFLCSELGPDV